MSDPARTATAVAFVGGDVDAQRMVLSWPLVDAGLPRRALVRAWSRTSGVPLADVRRLADVLLSHRICRADGSVCPDAQRVLQHVTAERLRGTRRRPS